MAVRSVQGRACRDGVPVAKSVVIHDAVSGTLIQFGPCDPGFARELGALPEIDSLRLGPLRGRMRKGRVVLVDLVLDEQVVLEGCRVRRRPGTTCLTAVAEDFFHLDHAREDALEDALSRAASTPWWAKSGTPPSEATADR